MRSELPVYGSGEIAERLTARQLGPDRGVSRTDLHVAEGELRDTFAV